MFIVLRQNALICLPALNYGNLHVGAYTGDVHPWPADGRIFATEWTTFGDLIDGLATPCPCGLSRGPWSLESIVQVVLYDSYCCNCKTVYS